MSFLSIDSFTSDNLYLLSWWCVWGRCGFEFIDLVTDACAHESRNLGLLLGLLAIWKPIPIHRKVLGAQLPWVLMSLFFFGLLLFDLEISFIDGRSATGVFA